MSDRITIVVPTMDGVTTAIVAFIFVCVVWPRLVKHKTQFYAAFAATLLIIFLHSLNVMIGTPTFQVFTGTLTGLLQLAAIVLLFSGAGGLSLYELTGEMARAFEVIRRGEEEKSVIIPINREPAETFPPERIPTPDEPPPQNMAPRPTPAGRANPATRRPDWAYY